LKPKYDEPLSNFAVKFNLRRYTLSGSGKAFTTSTRAAASVDIIVRTPDLYTDASVRRCRLNQ